MLRSVEAAMDAVFVWVVESAVESGRTRAMESMSVDVVESTTVDGDAVCIFM